MILFYRIFLVAAAAFSVFAGGVHAQAVQFYAAPNGNDNWSGRLAQPDETGTDGPCATVKAALAAARRVGTKSERRINILAGEYYLDRPLVLDKRDGGLQIVGVGAERTLLYGGRQVKGWIRDGQLYWAPVTGVKEGRPDFRLLLVNGRLAARARYPKEGTLSHESRFDVTWISTTGGGWQRKPTIEELTTLKYKPGDLPEGFESANAEVTVYHMWDESLAGIKSIDREKKIMTFLSSMGHPAGAFGVQKYVVWNTAEGLSRPGQWYQDRVRGRIVYWPLEGEQMATAKVIAPVMESILLLEETENVQIRDLCLSCTNTPLKAGGFGASAFAGAIDVRASRDCRLSGVTVSHVAGQGISVKDGGVTITDCHVYQVGACGIRASGCRVENNSIHHIGLIYPSAIGIAGGGKDGIIAHNEIYDTPYSAITCGGKNHRIESNKIHRVMLDLHDGAAIYVFAGKNTLLRGNMAYDIPDTGSAYYLDERSADCVVEGNLSYGIEWPCHNHMANGNVIRNNVFINQGDMRLTFPKSSGFCFENNVLCADGNLTFSFEPDTVLFKNNMLYSKTGQVLHDQIKDYKTDQIVPLTLSGTDSSNDPLIESWRSGQVVWRPDSPAADKGITPVDVSDAGPKQP